MKMHRATIGGAALGVMAVGVLLATGGCGSNSSNSTPDSGTTGSATATSSSHTSSSGTSSVGSSTTTTSSSSGASGSDAGADAGDAGADAAHTDGGDAGCTTLNVYNFKAWCSGTINGTTNIVSTPLGTTTTTSVCLPPGAVSLAASAVNGFELGPDPWISVSAADGGGSAPVSGTLSADGGTSTTTVTLGTAPGCVLLCCPFAMGVHGGLDAGPEEMSGCTSGYPGFSPGGGDAGEAGPFTALCP
jgi:hypothetical protein